MDSTEYANFNWAKAKCSSGILFKKHSWLSNKCISSWWIHFGMWNCIYWESPLTYPLHWTAVQSTHNKRRGSYPRLYFENIQKQFIRNMQHQYVCCCTWKFTCDKYCRCCEWTAFYWLCNCTGYAAYEKRKPDHRRINWKNL